MNQAHTIGSIPYMSDIHIITSTVYMGIYILVVSVKLDSH